MYMSQHRFTPVPEKLDQWIPYNRNYLTLTSRAPGAVLSRILHIADEPQSYFAVGLWTDKDSAIRWSESAESKLGAKPSQDLGLYDGYPMNWSRWTLIDFAWGLRGQAALCERLHVRHAVQEASPTELPALERANRAALSLMARRPGFVSGETYRGHRGDRLLTVLTFENRSDNPFESGAPPTELDLVLSSTPTRSAPDALHCTLFQCVWGPDAAGLATFIQEAAAA